MQVPPKFTKDELVKLVTEKKLTFLMVHYDEENITKTPVFVLDKKDGNYQSMDLKSTKPGRMEFDSPQFRMMIDTPRLIGMAIIWLVLFSILYSLLRLTVMHFWNIDLPWYIFLATFLSYYLWGALSKKLSIYFIKYLGKGAFEIRRKKKLAQIPPPEAPKPPGPGT